MDLYRIAHVNLEVIAFCGEIGEGWLCRSLVQLELILHMILLALYRCSTTTPTITIRHRKLRTHHSPLPPQSLQHFLCIFLLNNIHLIIKYLCYIGVLLCQRRRDNIPQLYYYLASRLSLTLCQHINWSHLCFACFFLRAIDRLYEWGALLCPLRPTLRLVDFVALVLQFEEFFQIICGGFYPFFSGDGQLLLHFVELLHHVWPAQSSVVKHGGCRAGHGHIVTSGYGRLSKRFLILVDLFHLSGPNGWRWAGKRALKVKELVDFCLGGSLDTLFVGAESETCSLSFHQNVCVISVGALALDHSRDFFDGVWVIWFCVQKRHIVLLCELRERIHSLTTQSL